MLTYYITSWVPFVIIFTTGTLTSFLDIRDNKIRNIHLLPVILLSLTLYAVSFLFFGISWDLQITSALTGFLISIIFFINNLWRAGDAKLFTTYALLMPATGYENTFPLPCIPLFINTFLSGLIFLTPLLIWLILTHPKILLKKTFVIKDPVNTLIAFLTMISVSWVIPILLSLEPFHFHPLIQQIIISAIYFLLFRLTSRLEPFPFIVIPTVIIGTLLGLRFSPGFYTIEHISRIITNLCLYSMCSQILHNSLKLSKKSKDRIPFSPFLFAGCLLSYTPFLNWILKILHR